MVNDIHALARSAYEAYGRTTDFKNYQGLPMPRWDDLGEAIQLAWTAAAEVAYWQGYLDGDTGNDPLHEPQFNEGQSPA